MHTRFTSIINELHSLGEIIPRNKLVRKILSVLPGSRESKENAITEAKDLQKLTIDELISNLKTYEMKKKKKDNEIREPKREKNLVLKADNNDSGGEDADMAYLTKRFQKMVRGNGGIPKRGSSSKPKGYDLCHKCWKVKQLSMTLDSSMMAVESEAAEYDSIFALMAKSDDDEDVVNFLDVQRNLKSYSPKKLMSLANVLIEAYHSLINDKNALTMELGAAEHEGDDLVVIVVDLKETIESMKKEKDVLTEKLQTYNMREMIYWHEIIQKGKEVANEAHLRLEDELKSVKSSMCAELEKNKQLQEDLGRVKSDLEKSLKWTWSSDSITAMYMNNGGNRQGIGKPIRPDFSFNGKTKFLLKRLKYSLMSVPQICDKGNKVEFVSKICTVTNLVTGEVVLVAKRYKTIYVAEFESLQNGDLSCLSVVDGDAELWHRRVGHASFMLLNKSVKKDLVRGLPKSSFKDHTTKDETFQVFAAFVKKIQVKMIHNVVCIRSNHGTKCDNSKFDELCTENGITYNFSAPKTPNQHGVVERKNRSLEDIARTMLIDDCIEKSFWAEAVKTACYLVNKCMIRSLLNKTPYELLNRRKPKLTHLRTFGCKCFVLNNGKETLRKFDAKSDEGIFLDYSSQSKAYKAYNRRTQCVEESINMVFDKSHHSCGKDAHDKSDQGGEQSTVPGEIIDMANENIDMMSHIKESNEDGHDFLRLGSVCQHDSLRLGSVCYPVYLILVNLSWSPCFEYVLLNLLPAYIPSI
ncbi:PREDICTED: uncharacterized protein LOC109241028 [Nicotiana attenuata]|uniref:uncharacterized protein LOC109241028 n=1 Tax=Nicotiana attenuata TaxID=49451 RepID=UPI0009049DC1|nr:PREDICTED: uncharacterized protein LOC109241028 [Nicotiana attenuata]